MIFCNLPILRETYFFMGSCWFQSWFLEEKPVFLFESIFNAGVFDSSHPLYHILKKLIQIDEENNKRCQNESTFDWDLFLTNLLIKITAYQSIYDHNQSFHCSFIQWTFIVHWVIFLSCCSPASILLASLRSGRFSQSCLAGTPTRWQSPIFLQSGVYVLSYHASGHQSPLLSARSRCSFFGPLLHWQGLFQEWF